MSGDELTRYWCHRGQMTRLTEGAYVDAPEYQGCNFVLSDEADALVAKRDARIAELEHENAELREQVADWESQAFGSAEAGPASDWVVEPVDPPVGRRELAHIFRTVNGAFRMTRDLEHLALLERLEAGQDARGAGEGS